MKQKKSLVVVLIIFLILNLFIISYISAPEEVPGLPDTPGSDTIQDIAQDPDAFKEGIETKWEYLGKEWRTILLKNKVVSGIDNFLTKISIVFKILFGQPYSLSVALFFVIVLWVIVAKGATGIVKAIFSFMNPWLIRLSGVLIAIALAQSGALAAFIDFIGALIFKQENKWLRAGLILVGLFMLFIVYQVEVIIANAIKESKKEQKQKEAETAGEKIKKFSKNLEKGYKN